jgi:serine protease Do
MGLKLGVVTNETRQQFDLKGDAKGVVVIEVKNGTPAAEKGMRPGDVIVEVGQEEVKVPGDVEAKINKAKEQNRKSVLLLVERQGDLRFVALPLAK